MRMYNLDYINEIEKEDFIKVKEKDFFLDRPLKYEILDEAVVLPYKKGEDNLVYGGVLSKNGQFVDLSKDQEVTGEDFSRYSCDDLDYIDEKVIYLGPYKEQWGHFITSVISRLWYYSQNPQEDLKIAYPAGEYSFVGKEIHGNYLGLLELIGFPKDKIIRVERPTRFRTVIVAERSHVPETYYTKEYRNLYEFVKAKVELNSPVYQKIYFTRCGNETLDSHDFGENNLREIFEKNGFHVIEPSQYSAKEQIWIIKNADVIATVSGSLTHNLVFAKDNVETIVLNRQGYPMLTHLYQGAINQMRSAKATHIEASYRLLPVNGAGPNIFYISDELIRFLEDNKFSYIPNREEAQLWQKYLVLVWYFLRWLDIHCKQNPLRLKRLEGQLDDRSIRLYGYFREKLDWYDSKAGVDLRNLFYEIVKKYGKI